MASQTQPGAANLQQAGASLSDNLKSNPGSKSKLCHPANPKRLASDIFHFSPFAGRHVFQRQQRKTMHEHPRRFRFRQKTVIVPAFFSQNLVETESQSNLTAFAAESRQFLCTGLQIC
jgi:hypothetical protein